MSLEAASQTERTLIVGDVHGCLVELKALLAKVEYSPGADRLIFVGDLLDRGPFSAETIQYVRQLSRLANANVHVVLGNHELKHLRFHRKVTEAGGDANRVAMKFSPAKRNIHAQLAAVDLDWMSELPTYFRGEDFLVVHAGVCPRRHLTWEDLNRGKYLDRLLTLRTVDAEGRMLGMGDRRKPSDPAPDPTAHPWFDDYDGRFGRIYYGHVPGDEVVQGPHSVGVDTGCCFGGKLTAAVLVPGREPEYVAVPARAAYAPRKVRV